MKLFFKEESLVLSSLFFMLIFFTSNGITDGDSGELAVSIWQLGTAHPPGYIIYSLLGKIFTLIPFGNIAFRIALFSVFFSFLSVLLVFTVFDFSVELRDIFIKSKLSSNALGIFLKISAVFLLMQSYSFFLNTVYIKFYTFVGFTIMLLFFFGFIYLKTKNRRYEFWSSFLLGLAVLIHNICALAVLPLLLLLLLENIRNPMKLIKKLIVNSFIVVTSFLMTSVYYFIVSSKPGVFTYTKVYSFPDLIAAVMRKVYSGGNTHIIESSVGSLVSGKFYFILNVSHLLLKQFHYVGLFFFVLGCVHLLKKDKKEFFYVLTFFLSFSFLLGLFTFNANPASLNSLSWLVIGNQYFIPAILLFILIVLFGLLELLSFAAERSKVVTYSVILFFLVVPLLYLPERFIDCNLFTNDVAQAKTKDMLATPALDSILVVTGDNNAFQSWYYKRVLGFREDLCVLSVSDMRNFGSLLMYGCSNRQRPKKMSLIVLAENHLLYSDVPFQENKKLARVLKSIPYGMIFMALPGRPGVSQENISKVSMRKFVSLYNYETCIYNTTDDPLTKELCGRYGVYLVWLLKYTQPKYGKTVVCEYYIDNLREKERIKIGQANKSIFEKLVALSFKTNKLSFYLSNTPKAKGEK